MKRPSQLLQQLLHAGDDAMEAAPPAAATAPSRWEVLVFIMTAPMECSSWIALLFVVLGAGSSACCGICLAYYAKFTGELSQALIQKDVQLYNASFYNVSLVIAAATVCQGVSGYCMKRIGLLKRVHLNRMLLQSYFAGKRLRDLRFMLSRCYLPSRHRQVLPAQRLPLRLLRQR